jgi:hypothetical protein
MKKILTLLLVALLIFSGQVILNAQEKATYWNHKTTLVPRRMPLPDKPNEVQRIDLDRDGDPDVLKYTILNGTPVMWVDDDDDMKWVDIEGDMDSDCLFIDKNKDGQFAGPWDLSIDYNDENKDGIADMQFLVQNDDPNHRNVFDIRHNIMVCIDEEKDGDFNYIDWNLLEFRHWEHNGHSNFFSDSHGNTLFTKMCASSFRFADLRYSWENPFIYWDTDNDGMTEMVLRMIDKVQFRGKVANPDSVFAGYEPEIDSKTEQRISYVAVSYDLDNDNGQGNEADFDMSLCFEGEGFKYDDQVNKYASMRGLPEADTLLFDASWRKLTQLIFPNRKNALDLTYNRGKWNSCRFVFDEDDDCNRWERVELYDPKDLFKVGPRKGGLDNNPQADAVGDRGEFDMDFSGKGNLYIGAFDGKIHLLGAEWGAWRIDQTAFSFQGFGGLYELWSPDRLQKMPDKFGTVKYSDTDNNGFIDQIQYDLDGDTIFEDTVSLKKLGIDDQQKVIVTSGMKYSDYTELFKSITKKNWERAQQVMAIAERSGLNSGWYAFWKNPRTLQEKYDYAWWLNFYIYHDLRQLAKSKDDQQLVAKIDMAYYSGDWNLLKN